MVSLDLRDRLSPLERLILLVSAICHDLGHPGLTNGYQVNAGTELAMVYNDASPLENYHCALTFHLLRQAPLLPLNNQDGKAFRKGVIACILATDIAKQADLVAKFKQMASSFDWKESGQREMASNGLYLY